MSRSATAARKRSFISSAIGATLFVVTFLIVVVGEPPLAK
jgi:hypothetical protein